MDDMGEWGDSSSSAGTLTAERTMYVRYLKTVHDEVGFRLALHDAVEAPAEEIERFLFEAEALANYGVL